MKILFPNPYGYKLPTKPSVEWMQNDHRFSDAYASFLQFQNGFSVHRLEQDPNHAPYLAESEEDSEGNPDFRILYGLDSGDEHYELKENLQSFIFKPFFFPIGIDYAGNDFVEILFGKYKGYIASLDHDLYASCDSLEEFLEEFELVDFHEASPDERADLLADDELGLVWLLARSMNEFTEKCIHCDEGLTGFVVDLVS